MGNGLAAVKRAKTVLLVTYKRDGTPVATPVSIAFDGDRAFFRSYHKAWKTKRLRNNPRIEITPATLRGKPTGSPVPAQAILLDGREARIAAGALARRHRVLQGILVPLAHRLIGGGGPKFSHPSTIGGQDPGSREEVPLLVTGNLGERAQLFVAHVMGQLDARDRTGFDQDDLRGVPRGGQWRAAEPMSGRTGPAWARGQGHQASNGAQGPG